MPFSIDPTLVEAGMRAVTTPEGLRSWLRSQPPDAVIGQGASPVSCPLSAYLADLTGMQWEVSIFCAQVLGDPLEAGAELPGWAMNYVPAIDERYGSFTEITAADALAVLVEVCGNGAA